MRALLLVLLVAACGSKSAPDRRAACQETIDHASSAIGGTTDPSLPPAVQAYMAEAVKIGAEVMQKRCVADHWSDAALACMKAAADQRELKACDQHLTSTQRDAIKRDSQDAMRKLDKPKL